jgi:hypothetical protein
MRDDQVAGKRIHQFHVIMDGLSGLPENDIDNVEQLLQVGEWQVALEILCTQVYEYELTLPGDVLPLITDLCRELSADDKYWICLQEPPTNS